MTNTLIVAIAVLTAVVATIFLGLAGVAVYFMVRKISELVKALTVISAALAPLSDGKEFAETMKAFQAIAHNMPALNVNLRSVYAMLESFVRAVVQQPVADQIVGTPSGGAPASTGASGIYHTDDSAMADAEDERIFARAGHETRNSMAPQVAEVKGTGSDS